MGRALPRGVQHSINQNTSTADTGESHLSQRMKHFPFNLIMGTMFLAGLGQGCSDRVQVDRSGLPVETEVASSSRMQTPVDLAALDEQLDRDAWPVAGTDCSVHLPKGCTKTPVQNHPVVQLSLTRLGEPWNLNLQVKSIDEEFSYQKAIAWLKLQGEKQREFRELSQEFFSFGGVDGRKIVVSFINQPGEQEVSIKVTAAVYLLRRRRNLYTVTGVASAQGFAQVAPLFDACAATLRVDQGVLATDAGTAPGHWSDPADSN